jgi:subfamily B ATP-binding cassette protein HlyB/CyaB
MCFACLRLPLVRSPNCLKHKRIWRDVLLACTARGGSPSSSSGLAHAPVHPGHHRQGDRAPDQSTLSCSASRWLMFMVFTAVMSWLRQYLVLHTGNRIDAVLGSQVFRHLLRLPLPYFENRSHRHPGRPPARRRTIREFISGAAVSLLLDLPFLLIFLAVMFWYSWQLSLIAVGTLWAAIGVASLVAPVFRDPAQPQFLLGARNQSFLTEYVAGMATVKSLQMEPHLGKRYGGYLAQYLAPALPRGRSATPTTWSPTAWNN